MPSGRALQLTQYGALDGDRGRAPRPEDRVIVEQTNIRFRRFGIRVLSDAVLKAVPANFCQADDFADKEDPLGFAKRGIRRYLGDSYYGASHQWANLLS